MHAGTLSKSAQAALAVLGSSGILKKAYLAGGSALALQLGHRRSYDFDFYTRDKILAEQVVAELAELGDFKTTLLEPPHTILGLFNGVKFSLFRYDYPLIGQTEKLRDIEIASVLDIAAMKLSAITGRATKRDYVDLYFITKKHQFDTILTWYDKKFGNLGNNIYSIIKAIGYFDDAETDKMPIMLSPVSWSEVKAFFASESIRLAHKYL